MGGIPVGSITANTLHYVEADHLGTPRAVVNATSQKAIWSWSLNSEAFGNTAPNSDPDADGTQYVFDLRFPGQRHDQASGLSYNYFRDYEAATGRYSQSDPIGLAGGISTYGYVAGNPMAMSDSLGLVYGNGVVELEDVFFGPVYWANEQMGWDPSFDQSTVDFFAGFGDSLSFGATRGIRAIAGIDGGVDRCSTAYAAGEWTEIALEIVLTGGAAGLRHLAAQASQRAVRRAFGSVKRTV